MADDRARRLTVIGDDAQRLRLAQMRCTIIRCATAAARRRDLQSPRDRC
jgi:hypothetical protein